jgi:hypothetical protein
MPAALRLVVFLCYLIPLHDGHAMATTDSTPKVFSWAEYLQ